MKRGESEEGAPHIQDEKRVEEPSKINIKSTGRGRKDKGGESYICRMWARVR